MNAKNDKNCQAILIIFRHLWLAKQPANGDIELTLKLWKQEKSDGTNLTSFKAKPI